MQRWDAVVIGGGPAGLTGATYLARFRRRVLLVDAGRSRAKKIPLSHNYPGFPEGVAGKDLLSAMQRQADRHTVPRVRGEVESIERTAEGFVIRCEGPPVEAALVMIATGATDIWPDLPQAAAALQQGVLRFCPVCDAYEIAGRAVGVLVNGPAGVREALYLRHFSPDVTVILCGTEVVLATEELAQLRQAGVAVAVAPPQAFRLEETSIAVEAGARTIKVAALYCALGMEVRSGLALALGAARDAQGYLVVDDHQQTSVPGLYAAGDVASGLNQISVATGAAAVAASAMHVALNTRGTATRRP